VIIDLFSGANGWGEGLKLLNQRNTLGIEIDPTAAKTAVANGHPTLVSSVTEVVPQAFNGRASGEVGSPPCQGFSLQGLQLGIGDMPWIRAAIGLVLDGTDSVDAAVASLRLVAEDERTALVLEPLRWALDVMPEWVAWEQVPAVLPVWQMCADVLRAHGYSAWSGVVNAEQYGVPQTRRRAVLIASRVREVGMPIPTHSRFHSSNPGRLDEGVLPWVSIVDALGYDPGSMRSNYGTGGDASARGVRLSSMPAPTMTSKAGRNYWVDADGTKIRRVTLAEAALLQTFPAGYVFHGTATEAFLQVGNAVPPVLAAHIVAEATGLALPSELTLSRAA
jgi:DNA (cytosine-5)-methyltransferase 1